MRSISDNIINIKSFLMSIFASHWISEFLLSFYLKFEPVVNLLVITLITLFIEVLRYYKKKYYEKTNSINTFVNDPDDDKR